MQIGERFPQVPIEVLPIIQAGAGQRPIIELKSEWFDEVEGGAGGDAEAADVAGIGRNFR